MEEKNIEKDLNKLETEQSKAVKSKDVKERTEFMKRPQGRPPTNPIGFFFYILKIILLNPWILLGIVGGIFAYILIHTLQGVIIGIVFGIIIGYILFRGNQ